MADLALVPDTADTKGKLEAGFRKKAAIWGYIHEVSQFQMPQFPTEPGWAVKFRGDLEGARAHAVEWTDTLGPELFSKVPQSILDYANLFSASTSHLVHIMNDAAEASRSFTPAEADKIDLLFKELSTELNEQSSEIAALSRRLKDFRSLILADQVNFRTARAAAHADAGIAENEIEKITLQMKRIRQEIESANQARALSGIGIGLGLFVGVAALALTVASGGLLAPLALAVAVVGTGAGTYEFVASGNDISSSYAELQKQLSALSAEKAQAAALSLFDQSIEALVDSCDKALSYLDDVGKMWATLASRLDAVVKDLRIAKDRTAILAQLTRVEASRKAWQQLTDFAVTLQRVGEVVDVQQATVAAA